MPFKTIVAIIQSADDIDRVLACAQPMAKSFGATLIGVHAESIPMAYSSTVGFPDVEFIRTSMEMNTGRSRELAADFATRMAKADQPHEWRGFEDFSSDSSHSGARAARAADLVVVAQRDPETPSDQDANIDTLLFEAGRPVLVAPLAGVPFTSFDRVMVAWNGSREAARAAFDALPFMVEAAETEIVVIDPPDDRNHAGASGADIAAALARHGANVTLATEVSDGRAIDDVIDARVTATGADLLVLGAYSHSWLRELLFGGVTRTVLRSASVPTFMSR